MEEDMNFDDKTNLNDAADKINGNNTDVSAGINTNNTGVNAGINTNNTGENAGINANNAGENAGITASDVGLNEKRDFKDEQEFKEFKRLKRIEEAKAMICRVECDCLSAYTDKATLKGLCKRLDKMGLGSLIVLPNMVKPCVSFLGKDPSCAIIAAISYPHGGDVTEIKVAAVKRAVKDGVDEVEVYSPLALIKDGNWAYFKKECKKLKSAARHRALRIVFDCEQLNENELVKAAIICADCNVNTIRLDNTSDVAIIDKLKNAVKDRCKFKTSNCKNFAEFQHWTVAGVDSVSCVQPENLAKLIMSDAENS
jgi:deoxyribose-phosphate aldolase